MIIQTDNIKIVEKLLNYCDSVAIFPKYYSYCELKDIFDKFSERLYLVLPIIAREGDLDILRRVVSINSIKKIIVNNIYGINLAQGKQLLYGIGMNIVNPSLLNNSILSLEFDGKQVNDNFVYVYGRAPLMTFAHCPKKTVYGKCIACGNEDDLIYVDENANEFPLHFYKNNYCYAQLLNCVPINLLDVKFEKQFVDFVGLDDRKIDEILQCINRRECIKPYTRGYYNKKLV